MPTTTLRKPPANHECGLGCWHPEWLQRYATSKMFMTVYGLLGTIQATSYMYFVVTLTTIEKRFKIPSQTTGIILSGNEISQILLSLILSYIGGQRNRPRWIAWGIVFCGLSCYIIALPHFIYGAGEDAYQLTKEYQDTLLIAEENITDSLALVNTTGIGQSQHLCGSSALAEECGSLISIVPLILIFLSQFVLGVGNTLYYALGQTYLDDNTKKTNTPLMLSMAMSLRMIGPIFGFFVGYLSLNMFIDPKRTPLIDNTDPRWLGAWWFGWIILGTIMILFSGLISLFPKQLPKMKPQLHYNSHLPQVLRIDESDVDEEGLPLGRSFSSNAALDTIPVATSEFPTLKDFPKALMRLLRNKLLIFNIVSAIFYILGAAGYMTFLTKYMEVQFHKSAQSATIVVGPVSIIGMVIGLLGSGIVISKLKPSPSKVLMWNVFVGIICILGQLSYLFWYCSDSNSTITTGGFNLTATCNANCACDEIPYSPICHEPSGTTYFSPCHAGCHSWDSKEKFYSNCSCLADFTTSTLSPTTSTTTTLFSDSTEGLTDSMLLSWFTTTTADAATTHAPIIEETTQGILERVRRTAEGILTNVLKPGVCIEGCNAAFWSFAITSMVINWFGSSGRIGNVLVNYRAVSTEDKSFAQGLTLMLISLFALIPGPILFGRIIDSTCLVWTKTCSGHGNCQLYDQTRFRMLVNTIACCLTTIGVTFDVLVWYYGRSLDMYGERETQHLEEQRRKNQPIMPLLANSHNNNNNNNNLTTFGNDSSNNT